MGVFDVGSGRGTVMSRTPYWAFLALSAVYLAVFGLVKLLGATIDTSEFGPLETAEHIILFITTGFWTLSYLALRRQDPQKRAYNRHFAAFFACLSYLSLGREISWFDVYEVDEMVVVSIEMVSGVLALLFLMVLAFKWWRNDRDKIKEIKYLARAPVVHILMSSFVLILSADLFEKRLLGGASFQFFEEAIELWGYGAFAIATFWAWHVTRKS